LYNIKIISLESRTSKLSNDIYFVIHMLHYHRQIYDLGTRLSLVNWDGGSIMGCKHLS
jgi:hypothetical protein